MLAVYFHNAIDFVVLNLGFVHDSFLRAEYSLQLHFNKSNFCFSYLVAFFSLVQREDLLRNRLNRFLRSTQQATVNWFTCNYRLDITYSSSIRNSSSTSG